MSVGDGGLVEEAPTFPQTDLTWRVNPRGKRAVWEKKRPTHTNTRVM